MLRNLLSLVGLGEIVPSTAPPGLVFLLKLAWESRIRLPLLIAVVFMLTDYHLQLEIDINIQAREEDNEQNNQQINPVEPHNQLPHEGAQLIIGNDDDESNPDDSAGWETASSSDDEMANDVLELLQDCDVLYLNHR